MKKKLLLLLIEKNFKRKFIACNILVQIIEIITLNDGNNENKR